MEYIVAGAIFLGIVFGLARHAVKTGAGQPDSYDKKLKDQKYEDIVGA